MSPQAPTTKGDVVNIVIASVAKTNNRLNIAFDHDFADTAEGRRALRVLCMHLNHSYEPGQRAISMRYDYHSEVATIDTRAKCQAEMDKLANVPITVTFDGPRVLAYGVPTDRSILKNRAALAAARAAGYTIGIVMQFRLSLPTIEYDRECLREFVPGTVSRSNDDRYLMGMEIRLQGRLTAVNPWKLINDLKPRIQAVIV